MMRKYIIFLFMMFFLTANTFADVILVNQINGIDDHPLKNAEQSLQALQTKLQPLNNDKIQEIYKRAPQTIQEAIQPYGFFRATIKKHLVKTSKGYLATYDINPGPAIRITHLTVKIIGDGKNDLDFQKFLQNFPLHVGDVLHTQKYEKTKQAFFDIAQLRGYLNGNLVSHQIQVNLQNYTADLVLVFDTGPRYYFGEIYFSQNPYASSFLKRFAPFKEGDPYSSDDLIKFQNNLNDSIYFQHVSIQTKQNNQTHNVPIDVLVVPRKPQQYSIGAGYGTDTGFRGSLGWEWRQMTKTGHYFQAIIQASQIQNNFQLKYVIPGKNPVKQHYEIFAGAVTNEPGNGQYRTYQFGGSYNNSVGTWQRTYSISYQHERFSVIEDVDSELTEYIVPAITWQKVQANDRVNTNNGYRIYLVTQGGSALNVDSQFAQAELQAKYIRSFWGKNRILLRTDLGYTAVKNLSEFPLSLRYFAGGAQSVRGYAFQSLGPGKYLIIGSAELQPHIYKKLNGVIFYDAGNAFNNSPVTLQRSAGAGLVYRSPIGPIEVTIAHPIDNGNPNFWKSLKLQFIMGPDL